MLGLAGKGSKLGDSSGIPPGNDCVSTAPGSSRSFSYPHSAPLSALLHAWREIPVSRALSR